MTPPPSSMTIGGNNPATVMSMHSSNVTGGMGQTPATQWGNPSVSMPPQSQYNMKGYAPAPWLAQGTPPGMSYGSAMQQRMQMDEQRRRHHILRLHQERLIRARQMQQQPAGMTRSMYPPSQMASAAGAGYMVPPTQPSAMGQPSYTQQPTGMPPTQPASNMSMDI